MGLDQVEAILRPTTRKEAWDLKMERGTAARFLGGGIDLALFAPATVTSLIDLGALDLSSICEDAGGLRIGATTTLTEGIESLEVAVYAGGFLRDVLRQVAAPLHRNVATFGGTLASAHPWSDVIPALLVLDAQLVIFDGAERCLSLESFYEQRRAVGRSLICAIRLPATPGGGRGEFISYTQTVFDVGMLNVACFGSVDDRRWSDVRISIGATPRLATRLRSVEGDLVGEAIDEEGIVEAGKAAATAIAARDDRRAGARYRETLAARGVERCLRRIGERPKGEVR